MDAEARGRGGDGGAEPPLGMRREPARDVAGHVEFGHDADAPVRRRSHQRIEFVYAVRRPSVGEFGMGAGPKAEGLIVGQVEVQHVELEERHGVQGVHQRLGADEVPGGVDHEPPPGEPGYVVDGEAREMRAIRAALRELDEGGEGAQHAPLGRRFDLHSVRCDGQPVAFVVVERRELGGRRAGNRDGATAVRSAGDSRGLGPEPPGRATEPGRCRAAEPPAVAS